MNHYHHYHHRPHEGFIHYDIIEIEMLIYRVL